MLTKIELTFDQQTQLVRPPHGAKCVFLNGPAAYGVECHGYDVAKAYELEGVWYPSRGAEKLTAFGRALANTIFREAESVAMIKVHQHSDRGYGWPPIVQVLPWQDCYELRVEDVIAIHGIAKTFRHLAQLGAILPEGGEFVVRG